MGRWMGRWRSGWVREGLTFDESGEEVDVDVFGLGALEEPEEHLEGVSNGMEFWAARW